MATRAVTGAIAAFPPPWLEAAVFDMDGVVTRTATAHAAAWKRLFDDLLRRRADASGEPFVPFDAGLDYARYVDGMARSDGIRRFLASRGIRLPEGEASDGPDRETVVGLGDRKNRYFRDWISANGVEPYESTIDLIRSLLGRGIPSAIVSASRNAPEVLAAAGVADLFAAQVDGRDAARLGLPGKPDPAIFLEAARRLGVDPSHAAVFEDAAAGVEAGRRGRFGLVVGIDRATGDQAAERRRSLREHGADVIVDDLAELLPDGGAAATGEAAG